MKVHIELTSWEVDLVGVDLMGGHLWKTDGLVVNPDNAHSNPSSRKRRSRRRLEEFMRRKDKEHRIEEAN